MASRFLAEVEFELGFESVWFAVPYQKSHAKARVESAFLRRHTRENGSLERECGVLLVRDTGHVARPVGSHFAVVVRADGGICELPDFAGDFVARFTSENGRHTWYVFEGRAESAAPPLRQARHTTAPRSDEPLRAQAARTWLDQSAALATAAQVPSPPDEVDDWLS